MTRFLIIKTNLEILLYVLLFLLLNVPIVNGGEKSVRQIELDIPFVVKVEYVLDGDSLVVRDKKRKLEVRLWGIDAPEYDQPGSNESKMFLKYLVGKKIVSIQPKDIDRYGRIVAVVRNQKHNLNEELVRNGHAWVHVYYCNRQPCRDWKLLEKRAREKQLGLWKNLNPVSPWVWKKKK